MSEQLALPSCSIAIKNKSRYIGDAQYDCEIFVDAEESILKQIDHATYLLHRALESPVRKSYNRDNKFMITLRVWGEFGIQVKIGFKDGHVELLSYRLRIVS
jgi:transcription initiation factor IIF auxiliary subunit